MKITINNGAIGRRKVLCLRVEAAACAERCALGGPAMGAGPRAAPPPGEERCDPTVFSRRRRRFRPLTVDSCR